MTMESVAASAAPSTRLLPMGSAAALSIGRRFGARTSCAVLVPSASRRVSSRSVAWKRRDLLADGTLKFNLNFVHRGWPFRVAAQAQEYGESTVKVEDAAQELQDLGEETKEEALQVDGTSKTARDPSAEKAIEVLRDTTEKLKEEAEKARAVLAATAIETAELGKTNLNLLAEAVPEGPIKEIAQTAVNAHLSESPKQGAKIHDFCLGIPYGSLLVGGGLIWFIITGSTAAIRFGVILGGILLALSISSLKIWKQGKSSIPYIQGQAAIAAVIFIRDARKVLEGGGFFPTAVSALVSGAMLAFYIYVHSSGGNPPKKQKLADAASAS